jgi:hypothetical protein
VLKDDELYALAGGEMNTSSLQSESGVLQLRHDTSNTNVQAGKTSDHHPCSNGCYLVEIDVIAVLPPKA